MDKKELLKAIIKALVIILTSVASSLSVQSCNPHSTIYYTNIVR